MTREQHLLIRVMEECAEVAQRASKALVFGLQEVQPGQDLTNEQRLLVEFADLLAVLEMLDVEPFYVTEEMLQAKKAKVEKYLAYSEQCGTLDA